MTHPVRHSRRLAPALRLKPVALALACIGLAPALAQTVPTGGSVRAGTVTIGTPTALGNGGMALGINQTSTRGVVNWSSFSIGALDRVNVVQPSTASVLLNRVTGAEPSLIAGALSTSLAGAPAQRGGSVFLVNPSGVTFAAGSSVSVGGLVASTLDIQGPDEATRNASFMASGLFDQATVSQLSFAGNSANAVTVQAGASITADPGSGAHGTVALLGAAVSNAGTITAPGGAIHLGSASDMTLAFDPIGDGLTTLRINAASTVGGLAENTGSLIADGGRITLRAAATAAGMVVRQGGILQAKSLSTRGGEIVLDAGAGAAGNLISIEGGTLDASGTTASAAGGTITVNAPAIRVDGAATLDVSGTVGGSVGLASSGALGLAPTSVVRADGASGAGGRINLTAVDDATLAGTLSARGATDGGQITTGARVLQVARTAQVDAGGGTGANGNWSLDATYNLHVTAAGTVNDPVYDPEGFGGTNRVSAVADAALGGALGRATDVVLSGQGVTVPTTFAPDGVRFEANAQVLKTEGRASRFTVNSHRVIAMANGSAIRSTGSALDVDFNADAQGAALGDTVPFTGDGDTSQRVGNILMRGATIATAGGDIRFYGQSDPLAGRAIGGYSGSAGGDRSGIVIGAGSNLDTCAGTGCTGSGSITLRGQGATVSGFDGLSAGAGVQFADSGARTNTGAITIDGRGGLGASGVEISTFSVPVAGPAPGATPTAQLRSASGDVTLIGSSRGWAAGEQADTYAGTAGNAGVALTNVEIVTGGSVRIDGRGGDVGLLQQDADFLGAAAAANSGAGSNFGASQGVHVSGSSITAGTGRQIELRGTAGTRAFTVDGGATPVLTPSAIDSYGVLVEAATTNGLLAEGGQITIDGRGTDVGLVQFAAGPLDAPPYASAPVFPAGSTPRTLVSTASAAGAGGVIAITGRNVVIDGINTVAQIDASGATGGGSVTVRGVAQAGVAGSGIVSAGPSSLLSANATGANGNGGTVQLVGDGTLRAFGQLQARGGSTGGNGGHIETSAAYFDLSGLRTDASATAGTAGVWLVDPFDVSIVPGAATGSLPTNPFVPLATSVVQDGDINRALNAGTSVTITTGTGGSAFDGDIVFAAGVNIDYNTANGPLTFRLDAHRSIRTASPNVTIQSSGAGDALNVVFNADANNSGPSVGGGQVSFDGAIFSNGGDVTMNGNWSATGSGDGAIALRGVTIDTRVGRSDAGAGGNVRLIGQTTTPVANDLSTLPAVLVDGTAISTSTGSVVIDGSATNNTGVRIDAGSAIATTSGDVRVTGRGTDTPAGPSGGTAAPSAGVWVTDARIDTVAGGIVLRGYVDDTPKVAATTSAGVRLQDGAQIASSGGGDLEISGSALNNGAGVVLQPGLTPTATPGATPGVSGSRHLLLRASNDGSADAIVIEAPVAAAGMLNLRPGGIDAAGTAFDATATPIVLGGGAANGFAVSSAEFAQLQAPTIVAGSDAQAADIRVAGAIATPNALTLQNDGGGALVLEGAVSAATLGLLSAGNIGQTAAAPITAGTLLARSTGGAVDLSTAANSVGTLGGGAAGGFRYVDANALTVGPVSVLGADAATSLPQAESAGTLNATHVLVRTLAGDLSLGTDVSGTAGTDLVAGARFQNLGAHAIGGGTRRIWADTWVGETRGGLAGSGPLPNLYHCAYLGLCTVTVPPADNHFIYAQQPTATVVIGDATRNVGAANPPFVYSVTGLILGDGAGSVTGTPQTAAGPGSPPGSYAINGSFTSAAGYAVNLVPGRLDVVAAPQPPLPLLQLLTLPKVDLVRDLPLTYTFDRNIGPPPICFATGPLDGDRAAQGGDVLAREWSRVRSRPNLLSCVSTDRKNGCADF